uniref:Uncharacterized protein n=1 Tax=Anolis carolinensis TaxID=28377 RepID=H9GNP9_ANOCA
MADVSQYAVNHLVTFSIGEEDDLASVEDATRKLSVMDAQGKIWVQEMLLQVNGSSIKLFDIDSKDELENYGLAAVARCEAVRPESRSQSLLLLVCQDPTQLKPDVHFFECNLVGVRTFSSMLLEMTELLNRVFDDVEAFVGKLQKSAEAFRVLDQRKRSARGRRREPGEGLLTIRARPPSQEEFEDALAKIKYSFSILARLQSNITNPTSEELIHFLFNPLKMIVESSGGPEFASEVRNPMLTLEAVTLMRGCLGEKEAELWHSLGDNWIRPRLDFPRDYAAPYTPTFRSGWEPPRLDSSGQPWEDPVEMQHRHEERRAQVSNSLLNHKKWWKVQNRYGQVGYVPYNILSPIMNGEESGVQNHKRTAQVNGTSPVISKVSNCCSTPLQAARKNLHIQRAPDTNVPLGYDSNTAEVQTWLEAKGFNPFTVKAFGVLSGAQLFSLQKEEFKAVSPEEGARVYSQVTVQRALLEDSGKISELEAVMKKQKRKLEGMSE